MSDTNTTPTPTPTEPEINLDLDYSSPELVKAIERPLVKAGKLDVVISKAELTTTKKGFPQIALQLRPTEVDIYAEDNSIIAGSSVVLFHRLNLKPSGKFTAESVISGIAQLAQAAKIEAKGHPSNWISQLENKHCTVVVGVRNASKGDDGTEYPRQNTVKYFVV